jgi:DNA primase
MKTMKRDWVDFRAVKATVSIEMALAHYGITLHRIDRCYLRGRCPLPSHASRSSRQSFIVNTDKNAWACHSDSCVAARGGRVGGNVLDFVASMEGCSIRDAALRLQDWFGITGETFRRHEGCGAHWRAARSIRPELAGSCAAIGAEHNPPLPFTLTNVDVCHPYLAERRISPETAEHFGIGFFQGRGYMQGRIVIPIHNEDGRLIAYAGRSLGVTEPKYRFPPRFRKSLVLFNLHRAMLYGKTVVVVEGFFDCLTVHQAGLPCVVALMGCSLSQHQERLLQNHFEEVVLMLDGDKAGLTAGAAIAARLCSKISTRLVEIPAGSQPDQLGADQIRCFCIPGYF